ITDMATYLLFWNPAFSSYTMERFLTDFEDRSSVGNWSFYEHEEVQCDDIFYMVRCGEGKTGIVMRGFINGKCYESEDWSPKKRKHIFYADIDTGIMINCETAECMLTPDFLTEKIPDINWYGGHSGRRLTDEQATALDRVWFDYIDTNPQLFTSGQAWVDDYIELGLPESIEKEMLERVGNRCELCGYSYEEVFGAEITREKQLKVDMTYIVEPHLRRLLYAICDSCCEADDHYVGIKLLEKQQKGLLWQHPVDGSAGDEGGEVGCADGEESLTSGD
ncbi:MAG: hypothetical protein ACI31C_00640, partial [Muribaculaceae bacterium]